MIVWDFSCHCACNAVCLCVLFQIWDLADPDGKGYLDKQVGNKSFLIQCFDDVLSVFQIETGK